MAIAIPTVEEMEDARQRIAPVAVRTPVVPLRERPHIQLKLEIHQPINSFKIRGIFNAVAKLTEAERAKGLVTTSAGNTAQALAWCGRHFGVPARSLMPDTAPQTKIDAVRDLGGTPDLVSIDELFRFMRERLWEGENYAFIHPWIDRDVMVGHSSAGLEIVEDCPDVETVYVPVGGGGFIAGVASAVKTLRPQIRVIGVEPETCAALHASRTSGRAVSVECSTFSDGVAVPYMTDEMFPLLEQLVDDVVLISEQETRATIRLLANQNKIITEGAGALAAAAALNSESSTPSVAIVTGGSIDTQKLIDILQETD